MARNLGNSEGTPSTVIVGVPDRAALIAISERLTRYKIPHHKFEEPDFGMGLSAIATEPLPKKQRYALKNYPLWNKNTTQMEAIQ